MKIRQDEDAAPI